MAVTCWSRARENHHINSISSLGRGHGNIKILVTGGAGFIASHLCDHLLNKGHEVVIVDDLSTGSLNNVAPQARFYQLNINDDQMEDVITKEQPHFIYHFAAQVNVDRSHREPVYDADTNIIGTVKILNHALKYHIHKIIFASSAAVYGNPEYLPIDETHPVDPISFYGLSKYTAECYIRMYNLRLGLKYTILRFANVYGPRQAAVGDGGVIAQFMSRYANGKEIVIQGNGEQTRDFIYVGDVVEACSSALFRGDNQTLNISTNNTESINHLWGYLRELGGLQTEPQYIPGRSGDILHSCLDNSRAREALLWQPTANLKEGLAKTLLHYLQKK